MNSSGVTCTEKDIKQRCENISNQITNNLENDDMHKNFDKESSLLDKNSSEAYSIIKLYNLRNNLKRKSENSDTELRQSKFLKTKNLESVDLHKYLDKGGILLNQSDNEEYNTIKQYNHDNLRRSLKRKESENSDTELRQWKFSKSDTDFAGFSEVKVECSSNILKQKDVYLKGNGAKSVQISQVCEETIAQNRYPHTNSDNVESLQENTKIDSLWRKETNSLAFAGVNWNEVFSKTVKSQENSWAMKSDFGGLSKTRHLSECFASFTSVKSTFSQFLADKKPQVEHSHTISGTNTVTRIEVTRHPKLYRLLKEGEDITRGLEAKNPNSTITVADHVAFGSKGRSSKYISTCSNLFHAQKLRGIKTRRGRYRNGRTDIVEIDTSKLPINVKIIDLTKLHFRKKYEIGNDEYTINKFHKFAEEFSEVLIEGRVPAECLRMT